MRYSNNWWFAALDYLDGKTDTYPDIRRDRRGFPIVNIDGNPELGCYRLQIDRAGQPVPVYIFLPDGSDDPVAVRGFDQHSVDMRQVWPWVAKPECVIAPELYESAIKLGRWPREDNAEAAAAAQGDETAARDEAVQNEAAPAGIGHNSGAQAAAGDPLLLLRDEVSILIARLSSQYGRRALITKQDADACEDDRKALLAMAARLAGARDERNAEPQRLIDATNAEVSPTLTEAKNLAKALVAKADEWVAAENKRLREIAAAEARKAAEDIEAGKPAAAVKPPPAVLIGTAGVGRRRGQRKPAETAVITDLSAAAGYLASIAHPDLIEVVQMVANRMARSKARMPGVRMSWEAPAAARAAEENKVDAP